MSDDSKKIEIVLGNKNVAEAGSQQINITQNNFDPEKLKAALEGLRETGPKEGVTQTAKKKAGRKKKEKRERDIEDVFTYKWLDDHLGQARIVRLYQYLKHTSVGWLDPDAKVEDWCALFMGEPKPFKLKWTGTQQHLKHLFRLMIDREYITRTNTSVGQWEIVGSHFVDKNRRPFKDWDSQHPAKRKKDVLSWLAEFLNISADLPQEISDEEFIEEEFSYLADHELQNPHKTKFVDIDYLRRREWREDD